MPILDNKFARLSIFSFRQKMTANKRFKEKIQRFLIFTSRPLLRQSIEHLEKLTKTLKEYRDLRLNTDPVLEDARRDYLVCRDIVQGLRDQRYRNRLLRDRGISEGQAIVSFVSQRWELVSGLSQTADRWKSSPRPVDERY